MEKKKKINCGVYVTNLPKSVDNIDIMRFFSRYNDCFFYENNIVYEIIIIFFLDVVLYNPLKYIPLMGLL